MSAVTQIQRAYRCLTCQALKLTRGGKIIEVNWAISVNATRKFTTMELARTLLADKLDLGKLTVQMVLPLAIH